jgi:hypothetical protein
MTTGEDYSMTRGEDCSMTRGEDYPMTTGEDYSMTTREDYSMITGEDYYTTTVRLGLRLWCLMPLSIIFQLFHGGQFYWFRKPKYLEITTHWCK